jgi:DNA-binding NarL/FixJ family response regulator
VSACLRRENILVRPRALLADDHLALIEAETALLLRYFDVVGAVNDGATLVSQALQLNPDVIVADITMPVLDGIRAIRRLRESGCKAKIVFLTIHSEQEFVQTCLEEGALGYVLKSDMKAHLVPAIRAALAGQRYVAVSTAREANPPSSRSGQE